MNKLIVSGNKVPASHLPFSPGVWAGPFLYISGQASVDSHGKIITDEFAGECRRSFENLRLILQAAGLSFDDVVQVRNYVGKEEYLPEFNKIYAEFFSAPFPARTTIMGCLGNMLKFEVDAVAYKPQ
jgi:2-iminobutanoate/2-iminopropanoate deaminase